jgi:large subunit ribosomal protein L19
MNRVVQEFTKDQQKTDLPELAIGDTVEVGIKIVEGEKQRVQKFGGTLIAMNGTGITRSITVRRIVSGEGVECVFPLHSPRVTAIEIIRHGAVRRAKLYFLRDRVGKAIRLRERRAKKKAD